MKRNPVMPSLLLAVFTLTTLCPCFGSSAYGQCEDQKVLASDAAGFDEAFGWSVAADGDLAVVGSRYDTFDGKTYSGSAYIFINSGGIEGTLVEEKKLLAPDPGRYDQFGMSVSISGDVVVVGAPGAFNSFHPNGAAYVFGRDVGGPDNWGLVQTLLAPDGAMTDYFGFSVGISGDVIIAGAYGDDDNGTFTGSAYLFERDLGGTDNWGFSKKLLASDAAPSMEYGEAVAIDGDRIVIGARRYDVPTQDIGAVFIYERNHGGPDNWGEVKKLTTGFPVFFDHFGEFVAMDGDRILVGAYLTDDIVYDSGSAHLFEKDEGGVDNWGEAAILKASDPGTDDGFGFNVAIEGNRIAVGAWGDDDGGPEAGAAYLFERDAESSEWNQIAQFTASDALSNTTFGWSVAFINGRVLCGAPFEHAGLASGAVYTYPAAGIIDCNGNGKSDGCDVLNGSSDDLNGNNVPDECEMDCNENSIPDVIDVQAGTSPDCNANLVPDECDIAVGRSLDCNGNLIPDECEAPVDCEPVGVTEPGGESSVLTLRGVFPTPFRSAAHVSYSLASGGQVTVKVVDVQGRLVATLVDARQEPGDYSLLWKARAQPAGIYYVTVTSNGVTRRGKLVHLP